MVQYKTFVLKHYRFFFKKRPPTGQITFWPAQSEIKISKLLYHRHVGCLSRGIEGTCSKITFFSYTALAVLLQYIYFSDDSIMMWLDVIKGMLEDYNAKYYCSSHSVAVLEKSLKNHFFNNYFQNRKFLAVFEIFLTDQSFWIFYPTFHEWKSRFGAQSFQKRDLKNRKKWENGQKQPILGMFWGCLSN